MPANLPSCSLSSYVSHTAKISIEKASDLLFVYSRKCSPQQKNRTATVRESLTALTQSLPIKHLRANTFDRMKVFVERQHWCTDPCGNSGDPNVVGWQRCSLGLQSKDDFRIDSSDVVIDVHFFYHAVFQELAKL